MQYGLLAIDHQGMAGVVPSLKSDHGRRLVREQVDHLALALIAPLGADNYNILAHAFLDLMLAARRAGLFS
jgi:hypothetical protein